MLLFDVNYIGNMIGHEYGDVVFDVARYADAAVYIHADTNTGAGVCAAVVVAVDMPSGVTFDVHGAGCVNDMVDSHAHNHPDPYTHKQPRRRRHTYNHQHDFNNEHRQHHKHQHNPQQQYRQQHNYEHQPQ